MHLEWSPALTVQSVVLSVLSMLSSATKKIKPVNDAEFVTRAAGRGPKSFSWSFHDDKAWNIDSLMPFKISTFFNHLIQLYKNNLLIYSILLIFKMGLDLLWDIKNVWDMIKL